MSTPSRASVLGLQPLVLLAVITLTGWMAGVLWPQVLVTVGITSYGMIYLDSYAILAAVDAVRAGADPYATNPLDFLWRSHAYSDWWLALRWLGLGRADNFLLGSVWAGSFALSCWLAVKPRNFREAGWMAALLLSPPFLLVLNRANNDLVIFVLLMLCGVAATGASWLRQLLAIGALVLATGLKYYPAPAALVFLWARPVRRLPLLLTGALVAVAVTLAAVWPQISRGRFRIESGIYTLGAPLLGRDLGWSDPASMKLSVLLLTLAAVGLARGRFTTGLAMRGEKRERLLAAAGAIVLLACFTAGVSFAYRWIFLFWMSLWLWRRMNEGTGTSREVWTLRVGCGLSMLCLWLDGGLCIVVNSLLALTPAQLIALDVPWRLATQPFIWLLMMLLSGWLLEAAVTTIQEWWRERGAY